MDIFWINMNLANSLIPISDQPLARVCCSNNIKANRCMQITNLSVMHIRCGMT